MAEYTIQGIQERRRKADSINRMLARAQRDRRLRRFFTPSMLSEAMNDLNTYTAGYNAQVKAQEDAIRAQQEAEKQRIAEEQQRLREYGVRDSADVPGVIENRRRQAAVDKASSMAVRMTSRGTRGRRGTSTSARRGRGFFDRYFA